MSVPRGVQQDEARKNLVKVLKGAIQWWSANDVVDALDRYLDARERKREATDVG